MVVGKVGCVYTTEFKGSLLQQEFKRILIGKELQSLG